MTYDRLLVPFRRWHYEWIVERQAAEGGQVRLTPELLNYLGSQNSWTGVVDGTPIVCAGTMQQWPGRHIAWAYVARGTLPHLEWMTEQTNKILAGVMGRIEFTVRADFPAGQRWARSLGFEVECPRLKAYGPEGEDHILYTRFN